MSELRWGILSTATIGRTKVIPAMQAADRCRVVGIASREVNAAKRVADELSIPSAFSSYEELLSSDDIDAVYIPLPNHLHAEWTIAAARAGKHVLCEKPLALNSAQAREMAEVCAEEGVKLMEAFMYRLHPSWVAVREMLASGRIGELCAVQSWFSYFNEDPRNIRNIAVAGGGALYDIGCYNVNLSRMLFGSEPRVVGASVTRDPELHVDVLTSAMLEFSDGVADFTCSTRAEPDQRVHIYGSEGRISIGIPFNIPANLPTKVFVTAGGDPPVAVHMETLTFAPANQYTIQAELFARAALDDEPLPISIEDAIANMEVIDRTFELGDR